MKYRLFVVGLILAVGSAMAFLGIRGVSAQTTLTDQQRDLIRANCITIKNTLNQLNASDALLRVNRGQVYESMGSKLMDRFNSRLDGRNLDSRGVVSVTGSYRSSLQDFRANYITYERQLTATLRIDCTTDPDSFHASLLSAREKRALVHEDVNRLHQFIDDYRNAAADFRLNFERVSGENNR